MKPFRWGPEENEAFKAERGISFEGVVVAIESGGLLDILAHPNQAKHPQQRMLVVAAEFVDWFPGVTLEQVRAVLDHAARSALATT